MIRITNIWATDEAYALLRAERARFRPRREGEVFAMLYMSSFTEPDGKTVEGFCPALLAIRSRPSAWLTTGLWRH